MRLNAINFVGGAVQLPNGDVWTGVKQGQERPDNVEEVVTPKDASDAVAQMLSAQTGEQLSCVWCGQSFTRKQMNEMREHIEKDHKSVFDKEGADKAALEIAAAQALTGKE